MMDAWKSLIRVRRRGVTRCWLFLILLASCTSQGRSVSEASADQFERNCKEYGELLPNDCPRAIRPIATESGAACIARSAIPAGEAVSGGAWRYSADLVGSRWQVLIHDPSPCVRGGAYLIYVDQVSGEVLGVEAQQ